MKANVIILLFLLMIVNCGSKNFNSRCQNFNEEITIINIGNLSRNEIANLVKKIQSMNPEVIGMNVLFFEENQRDKEIEEIIDVDNIVLLAKVVDNNLRKSYFKNHTYGVSDLVINTRTNNVDEFINYRKVNDDTIKSFSVKIFEKYSSDFKIDFNNPKYNSIDFNGNCYCFPATDYRNIEYINRDFIEGNIVLLGYLGKEFEAIECVSDEIDVFYTDFNDGEKMYSTLITANILYTLMKQHGIK